MRKGKKTRLVQKKNAERVLYSKEKYVYKCNMKNIYNVPRNKHDFFFRTLKTWYEVSP